MDIPPNFNSLPLKSYRYPIGKDRLPVPPFFRGKLAVKLWWCILTYERPNWSGSSQKLGIKLIWIHFNIQVGHLSKSLSIELGARQSGLLGGSSQLVSN